MIAILAPALLLLGSLDESQLNSEQFRDLVRAKMAPLKSLIFVYEGEARYVGDPKHAASPRSYDRRFQGTFLYRDDGAALYDLYFVNPSTSGGVIRKRVATLHDKIQASRDILDAKQKLGKDSIESYGGTIVSFNPLESPHDLFPLWDLVGVLDNFHHEIAVEGWEVVDGHNCLRVRVTMLTSARDVDKERDQRVYWLDLERDAQALKMEYFNNGKRVMRIDEIRLVEVKSKGGTSFWVPGHCRNQAFWFADLVSNEPFLERTILLVAGATQINLNLPDSLFTVTRDMAWPSAKELADTEKAAKSGPLVRKFQSQVAPVELPYATDPVSVRKRVEANLAEADRQSEELKASSPARQTWSGVTVAQIGIGAVGVALLGWVALRQWRSR